MNISVSDSLFLTSGLALLMMGYIGRRYSIIEVTRRMATDHSKGTHHFDQDKQMILHRKRLSLFTGILIMSALGALLALVAALCVVAGWTQAAKDLFVIALCLGILGLVLSVYESILSNKAVYMEVDNTVSKVDPYYKTKGP